MTLREKMIEICKRHVSTDYKAEAIADDILGKFLTKFQNGKTLTNTIIDKYYPDSNEIFRDNISSILLEYVFAFDKSMDSLLEDDGKPDFWGTPIKLKKKECESPNSPDGKHLPIAYSCDPSEGYCCKYCCIEISSNFNE